MYRGVQCRPPSVLEEVRAIGKSKEDLLTYEESTSVQKWMRLREELVHMKDKLWTPKRNALRRQLYRGYAPGYLHSR